MKDRSAFSMGKHGVKSDVTKDYRWVDPNRIEERKYNDGYTFVKGGPSEDGTYRTKGNMVLMERSRDKADESAREKREKTQRLSQGAKQSFRNQIEKLSSKHGMDLHEKVREEEKED